MVYLSHVDGTDQIIAVVLPPEFISILDRLKMMVGQLDFPYGLAAMTLNFPVDSVRLIEDVDEVLTDKKVYQSWERGGEDPLEYYRYEVHNYEPKEAFWQELKPDTVLLWFNGDSAGFEVSRAGTKFHGYCFGVDQWRRLLS